MSRRKKFVASVAVAGAAFAGVVFTGGPANAAGCTGAPCGRAVNKTSTLMTYTLRLDDGGPDLCAVWNFSDKGRVVTCAQQPLKPRTSVGGWTFDKKDVDAFSFPNTGYHVRFYGLGQTYHERGVWTKIRSIDTVTCEYTPDFKTPMCNVWPHA